jgi:type I restriction enzyme S subunit
MRLRSTNELRASNVPWFETLPRTWREERLKHILSAPLAYGVLKPDRYEGDDGVPIIRILDVDSGQVATQTLERISPAQSSEFRRTIVREGDLVISVVGTLGASFLVTRELAGCNLSRALARVQLATRALPSFVQYWVQSWFFSKKVDLIAQGAAQRVLNLSDLREFEIALPTPDEQRDVVSFLDRKTRALDTLISNADRASVTNQTAGVVERQIEVLREYRQALITAAVTGKIDVSSEAA